MIDPGALLVAGGAAIIIFVSCICGSTLWLLDKFWPDSGTQHRNEVREYMRNMDDY